MGPVDGQIQLNGHSSHDSVSKNGFSEEYSIKTGFVPVPKGKGERPKVLPNVLHQIGNTPMIRLNRIPKSEGVECELCKLHEMCQPFLNNSC
jgi:hypothetical protein